jgi:hypothetical protein
VKDIRISPAAQIVAAIAVVAALLGLLAAEAPELRRYLAIKSM